MQRRNLLWLSAAGLLTYVPSLPVLAQTDTPMTVAASFDAMAELVKAVGGRFVKVVTLIPEGTEPHDFTPTTSTVRLLKNARLFVINGLGMEAWADKVAAAVQNPNLIMVTASDGASPIKLRDPDEIKEHGAEDPHLWLSLSGAEIEAKNIAAALAKADPANAQAYQSQLKFFLVKLHTLKSRYAKSFKQAPHHVFVTGHAAFAYLCRDFGIEQKSVEGVFAEGEPTANSLAKLAREIKKYNIKTVFSEDLVSPAISRTLANEAGAKVETIYTMESAKDGKTYLERMESNLKKIEKALTE